jgi:hypothetical protein
MVVASNCKAAIQGGPESKQQTMNGYRTEKLLALEKHDCL